MGYRHRLSAFAVSVIVATACSTSKSSQTSPTAPSGTVANLVKVSGDSQTATFNAVLPKPLVVKATDAHGNPTIAPGGASTCGLTTSKSMSCWGTNTQQQLGLPPTADTAYATPVPVPGMTGP